MDVSASYRETVNRWVWAPMIFVAAVTLSLSGCGGQSGKVTVTGKVTYDGKPVTNGDIRFFPVHGSLGRVSGAPVVAGVYEANYKGGIPVGTHRVEIRAFELDGVGSASGSGAGSTDIMTKTSKSGATKLPIPVYVVEGRPQFLPPKYNDHSELETTITGNDDPQTQDFELTSKNR